MKEHNGVDKKLEYYLFWHNASLSMYRGRFRLDLTVVFESGYYNTTESGGIPASDGVLADSLTPPVAIFSISQSSGPVPLKIQFTDHSPGNPTQWGWYFGDGGTSNDQNPEHIYTTPGVYPVGFLVANSAGYNKTFVPGLIQVQNPVPAPTQVPSPVHTRQQHHSWDHQLPGRFRSPSCSSIHQQINLYHGVGILVTVVIHPGNIRIIRIPVREYTRYHSPLRMQEDLTPSLRRIISLQQLRSRHQRHDQRLNHPVL
jgi:PKD repeat protein